MEFTFSNAEAFNAPLAWDTSQVTMMSGTFAPSIRPGGARVGRNQRDGHGPYVRRHPDPRRRLQLTYASFSQQSDAFDSAYDWSAAVCKAFEVEACFSQNGNANDATSTLGDGNPATCCTVDMGDGTFDPPSSASYGKVVAPPYYRYFMAPGGENCPAGTMITTHDECRVAAAALGRNPATWRTYTAADVDATFRQRSVAMWLTVVDGNTDAGAITATGASTVTDATSFTIPNDPATTWPVMEHTWFNQNAKHAGDWDTNCGSSCSSGGGSSTTRRSKRPSMHACSCRGNAAPESFTLIPG